MSRASTAEAHRRPSADDNQERASVEAELMRQGLRCYAFAEHHADDDGSGIHVCQALDSPLLSGDTLDLPVCLEGPSKGVCSYVECHPVDFYLQLSFFWINDQAWSPLHQNGPLSQKLLFGGGGVQLQQPNVPHLKRAKSCYVFPNSHLVQRPYEVFSTVRPAPGISVQHKAAFHGFSCRQALGSEFPHHHSGPGGVVVLYHKESPFSGGDRGRTNGHFPKSKHGSTSLVPAASILPSGFVHGRPACARDLDLCVFNHDYPIDKVQSIVDRYYNQMYDLHHTLYKTPPHEVQWVENYTLAFAQEKQHGSFVCRSEAVYLRIGWAKNWKGLWLTVVNTERFPQVTRVEKCKYRGKPCDYMVPCYKSSCKQREMLFPLIAVNPYDPGQKPSIELFPIPSGCVCYVDDFRFH
ncbi:neurotrophin 1-like [Ixodes scapularis]